MAKQPKKKASSSARAKTGTKKGKLEDLPVGAKGKGGFSKIEIDYIKGSPLHT